ncbi:hypothetical protein ACFL0V_01345 [Nanoarchaeota archaeon]
MKAIRPDKRHVLSTEEAMAEVEGAVLLEDIAERDTEDYFAVPYRKGELQWCKGLLRGGSSYSRDGWANMHKNPEELKLLKGYRLPTAVELMHTMCVTTNPDLMALLKEDMQRTFCLLSSSTFTYQQRIIVKHGNEKVYLDGLRMGAINDIKAMVALVGKDPYQVRQALKKITGKNPVLKTSGEEPGVNNKRSIVFGYKRDKSYIDVGAMPAWGYTARGVKYRE